MSELEALLDQILGRNFEHVGQGLDGTAWTNLEQAGLTRVGISEPLGGSGGDLQDVATIITRTAEAGLRIPMTERLLLAAYLAETTNSALPSGAFTASSIDPDSHVEVDEDVKILATCAKVPWASTSDELWLLAPADDGRTRFFRLPTNQWRAELGWNLAGEPRDTITIDTTVDRKELRIMDSDALKNFRLLGAMGRSCQILGALRSCFRLTHEYVHERRQFNRTLASHQVIQHELARMACEVAAAESAVSHAIGLLPELRFDLDVRASLAVAAAKVQTSSSATRVARAAHQLHGAIGLTEEHPLHHFSTSLWSWREEFGSTSYWARFIAELVRTEYSSDLWIAVTSQNQPR